MATAKFQNEQKKKSAKSKPSQALIVDRNSQAYKRLKRAAVATSLDESSSTKLMSEEEFIFSVFSKK